jgi:hypothetical protein
MEQALGVVTGQAPVVPGADMDTGLAGELPVELPAPDAEIETDIEVDGENDSGTLAASLGRGRR